MSRLIFKRQSREDLEVITLFRKIVQDYEKKRSFSYYSFTFPISPDLMGIFNNSSKTISDFERKLKSELEADSVFLTLEAEGLQVEVINSKFSDDIEVEDGKGDYQQDPENPSKRVNSSQLCVSCVSKFRALKKRSLVLEKLDSPISSDLEPYLDKLERVLNSWRSSISKDWEKDSKTQSLRIKLVNFFKSQISPILFELPEDIHKHLRDGFGQYFPYFNKSNEDILRNLPQRIDHYLDFVRDSLTED